MHFNNLAIAEFFNDIDKNIVLFIYNNFHFGKAYNEASSLLGTNTRVVDFQPTLSKEISKNERLKTVLILLFKLLCINK